MSKASVRSLRSHVLPIAAFAGAHFVAYVVATLLHEGLSLDEMPERSWLSILGGKLLRVLGFPYEQIATRLSETWTPTPSFALVLALFISCSLLWGIAYHCLTLLFRTRTSRIA